MNIWTASLTFSPKESKVYHILPRSTAIALLTLVVYEDPVDTNERVLDLEAENERLRRQLESLEREISSRSPTRSSRKPSQPLNTPRKQVIESDGDIGMTMFKLNAMNLSPKEPKISHVGKTPRKKIRKLTTRKCDLMDENDLKALGNCSLTP